MATKPGEASWCKQCVAITRSYNLAVKHGWRDIATVHHGRLMDHRGVYHVGGLPGFGGAV